MDISEWWFTKFCFYLIILHVVNGVSFRTCPRTETAVVPSGSAKASVVWVPPVIDGSDLNIAQSQDHKPGDLFPIGNTTVTYTALNFSDTKVLEKAVCSFVVTVLDLTPPLIQCPYPITLSIPRERFNITLNWATPTTFDNSGTLVVNSTHEPGDQFPPGVTEVTYTARDPSGNHASCFFNISLNAIDHQTVTTHKGYETPTSHRTHGLPTSHITHGVPTSHRTHGLPTSHQTHGVPTSHRTHGFPTSHKTHEGTISHRPHGGTTSHWPHEGTSSEGHVSEHHGHTMHHVNLFVHRNERAIEIACITFISLVLVALIILGVIYNKEILTALRLRHERKRTTFPSTSWEQCPQMDGMNDPLLNQEYMDYPKNRALSSEKPLLRPGEVLPLLLNGGKKGGGKQK